MKPKEAVKRQADANDATLTYCDFPSEYWTCIRTNFIEQLNRKIHYHIHVMGSFPDVNSTLIQVCVRSHHMAGTQWDNKKRIKIVIDDTYHYLHTSFLKPVNQIGKDL